MEPKKTKLINSSKNTNFVQDYTELTVYKLAFKSAMRIYELSKKWPTRKKYSLIDQVLRSSRSVCGNIAEAWRKRCYQAHFVSKLSDADTESAETEVWLDFALKCKYLGKDEYTELHDNYDHICRMLAKMMANPEKWLLKSYLKIHK